MRKTPMTPHEKAEELYQKLRFTWMEEALEIIAAALTEAAADGYARGIKEAANWCLNNIGGVCSDTSGCDCGKEANEGIRALAREK